MVLRRSRVIQSSIIFTFHWITFIIFKYVQVLHAMSDISDSDSGDVQKELLMELMNWIDSMIPWDEHFTGNIIFGRFKKKEQIKFRDPDEVDSLLILLRRKGDIEDDEEVPDAYRRAPHTFNTKEKKLREEDAKKREGSGIGSNNKQSNRSNTHVKPTHIPVVKNEDTSPNGSGNKDLVMKSPLDSAIVLEKEISIKSMKSGDSKGILGTQSTKNDGDLDVIEFKEVEDTSSLSRKPRRKKREKRKTITSDHDPPELKTELKVIEQVPPENENPKKIPKWEELQSSQRQSVRLVAKESMLPTNPQVVPKPEDVKKPKKKAIARKLKVIELEDDPTSEPTEEIQVTKRTGRKGARGKSRGRKDGRFLPKSTECTEVIGVKPYTFVIQEKPIHDHRIPAQSLDTYEFIEQFSPSLPVTKPPYKRIYADVLVDLLKPSNKPPVVEVKPFSLEDLIRSGVKISKKDNLLYDNLNRRMKLHAWSVEQYGAFHSIGRRDLIREIVEYYFYKMNEGTSVHSAAHLDGDIEWLLKRDLWTCHGQNNVRIMPVERERDFPSTYSTHLTRIWDQYASSSDDDDVTTYKDSTKKIRNVEADFHESDEEVGEVPPPPKYDPEMQAIYNTFWTWKCDNPRKHHIHCSVCKLKCRGEKTTCCKHDMDNVNPCYKLFHQDCVDYSEGNNFECNSHRCAVGRCRNDVVRICGFCQNSYCTLHRKGMSGKFYCNECAQYDQ
jgi:hypothetical protein